MKKYLANVLKKQAERYIKKYQPKIVVISGSVGKTSTTQAIATVLGAKFSVRRTIKNYNTDLGVPCSIFGHQFPESLYNPFAWTVIFIKNELQIIKAPKFNMLVLELGTDTPGEIASFSWLPVDIAVVTAVAPEHMEYFKTLDAVAEEELSVATYSKKTLINANMVDSRYINTLENNITLFDISILKKYKIPTKELRVVGEHSLEFVAAAVAVGREFDMSIDELSNAVQNISAQPGRMSVLDGKMNSVIIDDTYNSSPEAARAALSYLYSVKAPQRIALLGNMNELGEYSKQAHIDIGEYCSPKKLDLVVTLGKDANRYTAVAAEANECRVIETTTPFEAANVILQNLKEGAVILCKGSQNGVYAEETVKKLLNDPHDEDKLVRQSIYWKTKKLQAFREGVSS